LFHFQTTKQFDKITLPVIIKRSAIPAKLGCADIQDRQLLHRANHLMCSTHNEQENASTRAQHTSATLK
jgi:hypothetical protein